MRLLNVRVSELGFPHATQERYTDKYVQTLEFKEFVRPDDCWYAIVSHRWTDEEVTFASFSRDRLKYLNILQHRYLDLYSIRRRPLGWQKISHASRIAALQGYEWIWIDTCCIDKSSSAELSEAINSMFGWYQQAQVCYVFLHDVPSRRRSIIPHPSDHYASPHSFDEAAFSASEWFRRGWTLQELLAPTEILFFNSEYEYIGTRLDLIKLISSASGIGEKYLEIGDHPLPGGAQFNSQGRVHIGEAPVAERMAWASHRKTTRDEDLAYCLLGVFDVNMPLLYGEGHKAFVRLQQEIIRKSDDESIFAWQGSRSWKGLLAPTPAAFGHISDPSMESVAFKKVQYQFRVPYTMTNKGLEFTLEMPDDIASQQKLGTLRFGDTAPKPPSGFPIPARFRERGNVIMPLNCLRATKDRHGTFSTQALAIRLSCKCLFQRQALEGWRNDLVSVDIDPDSDEAVDGLDFSKAYTDDIDIDVAKEAITIGAPADDRPMKSWKVYFEQDRV